MKPEHVQVAATLRRMREQAGVTRDEAASVLGCTRSKIGDWETGRSKPKPTELERLLDHYGVVSAERDELVEFARTSQTRRKPSPYTAAVIPVAVRRAVDLEAQAISTFFYSADLIPGLLQTPAYAKALLEWAWEGQPEDVAKRLELRMERATVLTRTHRPPLRYWCVLGEPALRSNIGGSKVMREQIERLIELSRTLGNLVIQILPLGSGPHSFLGITVTLLRFPAPAPDMVIFEGYGREVVREDPAEISTIAHHIDLVRAKALGVEDSVAFMQRMHQELLEQGDT
jgi:transcriptional regulator with XRE-family HTH domain